MAALVEEMVGREEEKLHSVVRYPSTLKYTSMPQNHLVYREILVGLAKSYMDKVCEEQCKDNVQFNILLRSWMSCWFTTNLVVLAQCRYRNYDDDDDYHNHHHGCIVHE